MWIRRLLPHLVIWPPLALSVLYIVSFTLWTTWLSFTDSELVTSNTWVGFKNYASIIAQTKVQTAYLNLVIYGLCFVVLASLTGLLLAVLVDQRIRAENLFRSIFLYPMALSFIVTGTAWQWILNPGLGLEKIFHDWGWTSFSFDWLGNPDKAIFCVVIAAVWQSPAGFLKHYVHIRDGSFIEPGHCTPPLTR